MDKEKQQTIDAYNKLPKDIQNAITSVNFESTMQEIGKKHKLHIDQLGELEDETTLVMLGIIHPVDFSSDIKFRLNIDDKKTNDIVYDINERVFKPIKNSLTGVHNIDNRVDKTSLQNINTEGKLAEHRQINDDVPKKEDILKELEKESKNNVPNNIPPNYNKKVVDETKPLNKINQKSIVEEKLNQPFKIPRTETEHKNKETLNTTKNGYKEIDPYRESIE